MYFGLQGDERSVEKIIYLEVTLVGDNVVGSVNQGHVAIGNISL